MACLPRSPRRWSCLLVVLALGGNPSSARAEDLPYPAGSSSHAIEGLQTELVLPKDLSAEKRGSLVVILHGAGGTATGMAGTLASWAQHGYVVCAPKSVGQVWEAHDLEKVVKIAQHLLKVLPLDPARVHTVGFSNGGWNLPRIAFDETLKPLSATWVAAGFRGGAVPDWAGKMGALALAGSNDGNVDAARATVKALSGKARTVEVREQPGLGHEWPDKLAPYLLWWMGVQEGRFVPGVDLNFDWSADLARPWPRWRARRRVACWSTSSMPPTARSPRPRRSRTRRSSIPRYAAWAPSWAPSSSTGRLRARSSSAWA
jgi:dienelactone hydrolase